MMHQSGEHVINRLKRAGGHLNKVIRMIEHGDPCIAAAQQLHAVVRALEKAKHVFVQDHIDHCLGEETLAKRPAKDILAELKEVAKYI